MANFFLLRLDTTAPSSPNFSIESGGAVVAGAEITAQIDWTELYQEGDNRVNIYGQNTDGIWTPYEG
ncbi:hypothetical protein [Microcystis phage MaeS]|nr:hypothetical protein [Microcystis phage MaeS]